jgi:hypothetical protein
MTTRHRSRRSKVRAGRKACPISPCGKPAQPSTPYCILHQPLLPFPPDNSATAFDGHVVKNNRTAGPLAAGGEQSSGH